MPWTTIAVQASLHTVIELGRLSPGSCAPFAQTARGFAKLLKSAEDLAIVASIPAIRNAYVHGIEKLWAQHKLGHLRTCDQHHLYSSETFFESCPDCGKQAKISGNDMYRESSKHLFEGRFLEAMQGRSPDSRESGSPEPESAQVDKSSEKGDVSSEELSKHNTSAEERFLAMMHSGLPKISGGRVPSGAGENCQEATKKEVSVSVPVYEHGPVGKEESTVVDVKQATIVEPKKQLTMEERFLVAMREVKDTQVEM